MCISKYTIYMIYFDIYIYINTYIARSYTLPVIPAYRRTLPPSLEPMSSMRSWALTSRPSAAAAALRELRFQVLAFK